MRGKNWERKKGSREEFRRMGGVKKRRVWIGCFEGHGVCRVKGEWEKGGEGIVRQGDRVNRKGH